MLPTSITDAAGFTVASTIWNSVVDSSPKVSETVLGGVFKLRMAGFQAGKWFARHSKDTFKHCSYSNEHSLIYSITVIMYQSSNIPLFTSLYKDI